MKLVGLCLALVGRLAAQEEGSLKNLDLNKSGAKAAIDALSAENLDLSKRLAEAERALRVLQEGFGSVSSETEVFRRKAVELSARLESLGTGPLDARLLKLLNELKLASDERIKFRDSLIQLNEAVLQYQKDATNVNSAARLELEVAMRDTVKVLGLDSSKAIGPQPVSSTLSDSIVVSVKDDLALIVANVGLHHGVRLGMPFEVVRGQDVIGTVRIVDIRQTVSGALIQNLSKNKTIKVGDHLKVLAN